MIDVHTHIYPKIFIEQLKLLNKPPRIYEENGKERLVAFDSRFVEPGGGLPVSDFFWNMDRKLDFMNDHGIEISLVSLGNPWLEVFPKDRAIDIAKKINDQFAEWNHDYGNRIYTLGCLPMNDVNAALNELERVNSLGLSGVSFGCFVLNGKPLDTDQMEDFWALLESTDLPLLLHPGPGVGMDSMTGYGPTLPISLGYTFETTVSASRIVLSGILKRYPDLKIILSHAGGTIPFLAGRLDATWHPNGRLVKSPIQFFKKFYYDALCYHVPALKTTLNFADSKRVMYGTDHPFDIVTDPNLNLEALNQASISTATRKNVLSENAIDLFNLE